MAEGVVCVVGFVDLVSTHKSVSISSRRSPHPSLGRPRQYKVFTHSRVGVQTWRTFVSCHPRSDPGQGSWTLDYPR